jgi:hypothetical protein
MLDFFLMKKVSIHKIAKFLALSRKIGLVSTQIENVSFFANLKCQ